MKATRRLIGLDVLRGVAIVFMMFFHTFEYFEGDLDNYAESYANNPFALIIKFLGRWAGLFFIISGFVTTYVMYRRIAKEETSVEDYFKKILKKGLILIILGRIMRFLFARTSRGGGIYDYNQGPSMYSLILGKIETGHFQTPSFYYNFYHMGALDLLGIAMWLYGFALFMMFKNGGIKNKVRNLIILGSMATFIILISPDVIRVVRPVYVSAISNNQYFYGLILSILVGDTHCILPFFGYSLYGCLFGLAFGMNVSSSIMGAIGLSFGMIYTGSGIIGYAIYGEPPYEEILRTLTMRTTHLQIGLMILLVTLVYYIEQSDKYSFNLERRLWKSLMLFGVASLTIFTTEGFFGTFIKVFILDFIYPGWALHMALVVIYAIILIYIWRKVLEKWVEKNLVGSAEWVIRAFSR